jgi:hypothetical protein
MARWEARREHREAGGRTLTLAELGILIKKLNAEAEAADSEIERGTILLRLDDMEREFTWRTFLGEQDTDWPDDPAWTGQPASS